MGHRLVSSGRTGETQRVVSALLAKHGRTYCDELGNKTSHAIRPRFCSGGFARRCCFRLGSMPETAIAASMALTRRGWTSARKMAASTWEERTHVLNGAGYARYDESTSAKLGEAADLLLDRYNGDLRRLREEAGRDAGTSTGSSNSSKGLGLSVQTFSAGRYRPRGRNSILL